MFIQKFRYQQQAAEGMEAGGGDPNHAGDQGNIEQEGGDIQPKWQDSWREDMSGGDEGKLERLSRYTSPTAVADALIAAQTKISSGDLSVPFPDEGTDEEKAQWRSDHGIPTDAGGYNLDFDDGLVIGEDNQPLVDDYLKLALETNQDPAQVKQNVQWFIESQNKQMEEMNERDQQLALETNNALQAEWGNEYKATKNAIRGFLDTMPEDIRENFASARMMDGTPVLSNPKMLQWLADQALQINPASTLVPPGSGDIGSSIADEIAEIQKMMGDKSSDYWKGAKSEGLQKRYRDLLDAQAKMK